MERRFSHPSSVLRYFVIVGLSTLLAWGAFVAVLWLMDPEISGWIGQLSFYASLFLALAGTFFLMGFGLRLLIVRGKRDPFGSVDISLRQSVMLAVLLSGALLLQGNRLFSWWAAGFLLAALVFLECFFLIQQHGSSE
ncbi:MAG: hypothetical protein HYZ08_03220 [Candidatus Kerfeldbacteria bacterium]|nr:hypothetical protein [Candidatus Kerfeldbacteria bacterium]